MKVAMFENNNVHSLEREINKWLENMPYIEILDVRYGSHSTESWYEGSKGFSQEGANDSFSVLLFYKKNDTVRL